MVEKEYDLPVIRCKRCLHTWIPRKNDKPTVCPFCKSPYWDRKRENEEVSKDD